MHRYLQWAFSFHVSLEKRARTLSFISLAQQIDKYKRSGLWFFIVFHYYIVSCSFYGKYRLEKEQMAFEIFSLALLRTILYCYDHLISWCSMEMALGNFNTSLVVTLAIQPNNHHQYIFLSTDIIASDTAFYTHSLLLCVLCSQTK